MTDKSDTPSPLLADPELVEAVALALCARKDWFNSSGSSRGYFRGQARAALTSPALTARIEAAVEREREAILRSIAGRLVGDYIKLPQTTAELYDEKIDPSGALLGYLREAAHGR